MARSVALYSAVDDRLTHYAVDVDSATLVRKGTVRAPAKVQYAWRHPSQPYLYVSTSNGGPRVESDYNHVSAFAIGADGALLAHGESRPLPRRAVHMCVDPSGRYVLNGHNYPSSGITVHRVEANGKIGDCVVQATALDYGIYPHQVMVTPSGRTAVIVDRGNKALGDKPEEPGALRTFGFADGHLSAGGVVAPRGGYGFGPRHIAFHPSKPWLYASDERTNQLYMFRYSDSGIEAAPAFTCPTLRQPELVRPRQLGGPIHVHPAGHCVYVANRADHTVADRDSKVFAGGENNIAVYRIDPETGEPTLLQHADTESFHIRTFACDPGGRLLVTASIKALAKRDGDHIRHVPAALSVLRITADGRLELSRTYDVETAGNQLQYWMGMVGLD
ncbi:6-phosphogluconolactonase [Cupriavidus yeoncheonensis]|uniref:6-phosphogluconolactonase n=1 Tax=Cupriavidus yeoncheonensis TaxID=1462994 RepID=A0A916MXA3_9BURK|nr:beta-propeller fold lactonase family protein [Cupriavidus yeoncheonensis]CAG2153729.1 6-phosphogluconolactonase [Cupriavidus yeoncheonensis]